MAGWFKNSKRFLICGIVSLVAGVIAFIVRMTTASEMQGVKDGPAQIIQIGSKQMSRSEYFDYAENIMNTCTTIGIILLLLGVVTLGLYYVNSKKKPE